MDFGEVLVRTALYLYLQCVGGRGVQSENSALTVGHQSEGKMLPSRLSSGANITVCVVAYICQWCI